nr:hypothetical protein CFP56_05923 [Quercus suber]
MPKRSSGATAPRKPPVPQPSTPAPPEKESDNLGGDINIDFNELPNTEEGNPTCGAIHALSDNGKEEFREKLKDIDTGLKSFELADNEVTETAVEITAPSTTGPTLEQTNGPNLEPFIVTNKPTRWTRIARPSTSQEKTGAVLKLGKRSNTLAVEENPLQRRKASEEKRDYDCDYPAAVADIQPR